MDKIAALSAILQGNPADPFARYGLAMAYASAGRSDEALGEYETLLQHSPEYVPAYQMSAQLLLRLARPAEAHARLTEGLAAAAKTGNAHAAAEMQAMIDDLTT